MANENRAGDYNDANLQSLKSQLCKAAIDAYMGDLAWKPSGTGYVGLGQVPGPDVGETGRIETQFGSDSDGSAPKYLPGMKLKSWNESTRVATYTVDPWRDVYEPWISSIDLLIDQWLTLPESAGYSGTLSAANDAVAALTHDSGDSRTGSDNTGETDLAGYVGNGGELASLKSMNSKAVDAFKSVYGQPRVASIIDNQRELLIAVGVSLAAEQAIWPTARGTVVVVLEEAIRAFKNEGPKMIPLSVVGDVVSAFAGLIPGGGVATALAHLASGIDFLDKVTPDKKPVDSGSLHLSGASAEEVRQKLSQALQNLNHDVTAAEQYIATISDNAVTEICRRRYDYHIDPAQGVNRHGNTLDGDSLDWSKPGGIDIDQWGVQNVGLITLPGIASYLAAASTASDKSDSSTCWLRGTGIGLGTYGPYLDWTEFRELVSKLVSSTGAELLRAGPLLAQAAGFIGDADERARQTLRKQDQRIPGTIPRDFGKKDDLGFDGSWYEHK